MQPPQQRKNNVEKAEKIRNGTAFYAVLLCLSLICAVACDNEKKALETSVDPDEFCLSTDVYFTSEGLIITNTGDRSWGEFGASLVEGPYADIDIDSGDSKNDFFYIEKKVMPLATTVTVPWNKFVRDDGLRFDPANRLQGHFSDRFWGWKRISLLRRLLNDGKNGSRRPRGVFESLQTTSPPLSYPNVLLRRQCPKGSPRLCRQQRC